MAARASDGSKNDVSHPLSQRTFSLSLTLATLVPHSLRQSFRQSALHPLYERAYHRLRRQSGDGLYTIQGGALRGLRIDTNPEIDASITRSYLLGTYEPHIARVLEQFCWPGMQVADIGAHHGYFSLLMSKCVGATGHCYVFEAMVSNYERIGRSLRANGVANVTLENLAVSGSNGRAEFRVPDAHTSMGGIRDFLPDSDLAHYTRIQSVETIRLDDYTAARQIDRLDVLKMDVEGAGGQVLEGAAALIERCHPTLIIELHPFRAAGSEGDSLLARLRDYGYTVSEIEGEDTMTLMYPTRHIVATAGPGA